MVNKVLLNILVIFNMWKGCINMLCFVCSINMKLKVLLMFRGKLLEKEF